MTRYRASWVVPITEPPVRDGWIDVHDGVIVATGSTDGAPQPPGHEQIDLGRSVVLPGLVNTHTHLELSGLRDQVPRASHMPDWARQLMARTVDRPPDDEAIRAAVGEARRAGTALLGDISNTLRSVAPLQDAGMFAVVFQELLGFDDHSPSARVAQLCAELGEHTADSPRLRLAAHAPYSVSPALFAALSAAAERHGLWPLSVHAAESREELEFLRTGTGPWREVLEERGRWDPDWSPSTASPVEYLSRVGWLGANTLLVHGVQLTSHELDRVAAAGATVVTCPRSNRWTGAGSPPVEQFYTSGVRVAVGTDSLASVDDLNVFSELREIRRLAPSVPASDILRSATRSGAEALGFGEALGQIAPGAHASLISVRYAEPVVDVEEYLLSGIQPEQVAWLDGATAPVS